MNTISVGKFHSSPVGFSALQGVISNYCFLWSTGPQGSVAILSDLVLIWPWHCLERLPEMATKTAAILNFIPVISCQSVIWPNNGKIEIRARRKATAKYLKNKTPENWERKRKCRNEATRQRRLAIKQHWRKKISDELKNKPKEFYRTFRPFLTDKVIIKIIKVIRKLASRWLAIW